MHTSLFSESPCTPVLHTKKVGLAIRPRNLLSLPLRLSNQLVVLLRTYLRTCEIRMPEGAVALTMSKPPITDTSFKFQHGNLRAMSPATAALSPGVMACRYPSRLK